MVIRRAEAGHDEAAFGEFSGQVGIFQESGEIEGLALHKDSVNLRNILKTQMPAIGWKNDRARIGIDGASRRFELAIEEFVEAFE